MSEHTVSDLAVALRERFGPDAWAARDYQGRVSCGDGRGSFGRGDDVMLAVAALTRSRSYAAIERSERYRRDSFMKWVAGLFREGDKASW